MSEIGTVVILAVAVFGMLVAACGCVVLAVSLITRAVERQSPWRRRR